MAHHPANLLTAESRQHEIEQNECRQAALNIPPPAGAIGGQRGAKARAAQRAIEQCGVERLVFNNVYGRSGHGMKLYGATVSGSSTVVDAVVNSTGRSATAAQGKRYRKVNMVFTSG